MNAMRKMGLWLLGVVLLSLSCREDPSEPPGLPENCRDVPRVFKADRRQYTCRWNAYTLTWRCSGGETTSNWIFSVVGSVRYLSEADFVAERTPGVVRAVESSYEGSSSKAGGFREVAQYTYDDQQRLVSKTVLYKDFLNPFAPTFEDRRYTFTSWDEQGRPLAGTFTWKWTRQDGTELLPSCSDTFTQSYDSATGRITRTAGPNDCPWLAFDFSAEIFSVNEMGEQFALSSVEVNEMERICHSE